MLEDFIGTEIYLTKDRKKEFSKIKITKLQQEAIDQWLEYLEAGILKTKEERNYPRFQNTILRDLLSIPEKEIEKGYEDMNVEYSFKDKHGDTSVCVEAKATKTNLFALQRNYKKPEQKTPIDQTFDDMSRFPSRFGICTNYDDFILLDSKHKNEYLKFNFTTIAREPEKIKEFLGVFSYDQIVVAKSYEELREECITKEKAITDEFYLIFHETRLMLIKGFQEKQNVSMDDAIHYAQLFLNRLIFIFFLEDREDLPERLFSGRIQEILACKQCSKSTKFTFENIIELFSLIKTGKDPKIFGYGGGLFEEDFPQQMYFLDLRDPKFFEDVRQKSKFSTTIDETSSKIIKKYDGQISPIITNFLIMDAYNFTDKKQIDVKILGHIFEQSISDLEELKGVGISKQKSDGVVYTPEWVTEFICSNTILSYLSKFDAKTPYELVYEYKENIQELEKKFRTLKILDPACGSGAFILKTIDVLLKIHNEIQLFKKSLDLYTVAKKSKKSKNNGEKQVNLDPEIELAEIKQIIENNIYGVDVNSESAEITKLSLYLKIAAKDRKLSTLSENIKVGNSIIDDISFAGEKAFDWQKSFPNIFKNGGFDIVVGNPPYVRQEYLKEIKPYLKTQFESFDGKADLYVYFLEKSLSVLKDDGILGVIVSNKWMRTGYGENLRNYLNKFYIEKFIDFGDLQIWKKATTYPCIMIMRKNNKKNRKILTCNIQTLDFTDLTSYVQSNCFSLNQDSLNKNEWIIENPKIFKVIEKIRKQSSILSEYVSGESYRGILTGLTKAFVIDEQTRNLLVKEDPNSKQILRPFLKGGEVRRYGIKSDKNYLILTPIGIEISKYPAILKWLSNFKTAAQKRWDKGNQWYELRSCNYYDVFSNPKIIYGIITTKPRFTLDYEGYMVNNSNYVLPIEDKHLLGILNSKLGWFLITNTCPRVKGGYQLIWENFSKILIHNKKNPKIVKMVDKMLEHMSKIIEDQEIVATRIKNELEVDSIPKKLFNFYDLSQRDFETEIKKISKSKIKKDDLDEWQKYFLKQKKLVNFEIDEINTIDEEINKQVYDLYEISKDEQQIIENQIKIP